MLNRIRFALQGRSKEWYLVRKNHLAWFPGCAACNCRNGLEVHHIVPFSVDPKLELFPSNLITLCSHCHLVIGHLRDYKIYNDNVIRDTKEWQSKRNFAYLRNKHEISGD
jgi:hypothetical protein